MKKILLTIAAVIGLTTMVYADSEMYLFDSAGNYVAFDSAGSILSSSGASGTVTPSLGNLSFNGTIGNWTVNVTTAQDSDGLLDLGNLDLNSTNGTGNGSTTLTLEFSQNSIGTAFTGWKGLINGNMSLGGGVGTVDYSAYQANSNTLLDTTGTQIGDTGLLTDLGHGFMGSFAGSVPGVTTPYSLTQIIALNPNQAKFDWSGDAKLSPVPEPGSLMLLGSGLLGFAGFARKKFSNS